MRIYRRLETRRHQLLYLFLELTRRCNLRCRHCGSDCSRAPMGRELGVEDWLRVAEYVHRTFGPSVYLVLTGGEPLLAEDWPRLTRRLGELGFRWGLVSNGTTLTPRVLELLQANGLRGLTLSVDGPDGSHDAFRGVDGAFGLLEGALARAGRAGIPDLDAVTCVHPGNLDRLDEIAGLLIRHGIPAWRLFRVFPSGRAKDDPELHLDPAGTRRLLDWIREARPRYRALGLKLGASCEGCLDLDTDRAVRDFPFFCRAGINIAAILADGTYTGCTNNASRFHVGSWPEDDLKTCWERDFGPFRDRSWTRKGRCGACSWWKDCQGGSLHLWPDGALDPAFCYKDLPGTPERV